MEPMRAPLPRVPLECPARVAALSLTHTHMPLYARFTADYVHPLGDYELHIPAGTLFQELPANGNLVYHFRIVNLHDEILLCWDNKIEITREDVYDPGFVSPQFEDACSMDDMHERSREARVALRKLGWTVREIFYAMKDGSDDVHKALWRPDGNADEIVAAILADAE